MLLFAFVMVIVKPRVNLYQKKINIAVVAGFMQPFREIAAEFEKQSGIKLEATFTSAGKIYSQVINGAPYDIVLVDEERAARLFNEGRAGEPFIYARGQVVLWTARKDLCGTGSWTDLVKSGKLKRIAIAKPEVGIYGKCARTALERTGLWRSVEPLLIQSPDLARVFQFASAGSVDAGFCNLFQAYSEHGRAGCFYYVKEAPDVIHSAAVIKGCREHESAMRLADFLVSGQVEKIKSKYGFR